MNTPCEGQTVSKEDGKATCQEDFESFSRWGLLPTKLLMSREDIGADHSDVPAMFVVFTSCHSHLP